MGCADRFAMTLPMRRSDQPLGEVADELVVVGGSQPLLEANLRAEVWMSMCATDATERCAGCCQAPADSSQLDLVYRVAEEKGCYVRLVG